MTFLDKLRKLIVDVDCSYMEIKWITPEDVAIGKQNVEKAFKALDQYIAELHESGVCVQRYPVETFLTDDTGFNFTVCNSSYYGENYLIMQECGH